MKRIYLGLMTVAFCAIASESPHAIINNNHHMNMNVSISNEVIQNVKQAVMQPLHQLSDTTQQYASTLLKHLDAAYGWICEHPIWTTCAGITMCYIGLNTYGLWLSRSLSTPECWSMWKYHLSNEELEHISMQTLGHHLMHEIQRRYTELQQPDAFAQPIITFANEIISEYNMLHRYKYICDILSTCYLSRVSWYNQRLYEQIDMRIQRINIIWHVFISWLAEYKISEPAYQY